MQKEVKSTEERTQSKHFNTRVHLKYNKILICDDQTNNDRFKKQFLFLFSFLFKIPAILSQQENIKQKRLSTVLLSTFSFFSFFFSYLSKSV